jgi:hypothetical protein
MLCYWGFVLEVEPVELPLPDPMPLELLVEESFDFLCFLCFLLVVPD